MTYVYNGSYYDFVSALQLVKLRLKPSSCWLQSRYSSLAWYYWDIEMHKVWVFLVPNDNISLRIILVKE